MIRQISLVASLDALEPSVQRFCRERGLLADLPAAIELVGAHFNLAGPLKLTKQSDPEAGEEWIELAADARGSIEELFEAHRQFLRQFQALMPQNIRENVRLDLTSRA